MPQTPKISVVLPTYNRMRTLPRAVNSVLVQAETDFELIVVDDASTDETRVYLASLADPRIRTIPLPRNLGVAGARNAGLDAACAEIVCFLDSDDAYRPQRLSAVLNVLANAPDIVCTLSAGLMNRADKPPQLAALPDATLAPAAIRWALSCAVVPSGGTNISARRRAALAVGGFRSELQPMEDQDFVARLSQFGGCRLMSAVLWEKHQTDDALTARWRDAGAWLRRYAEAYPEYFARYRKLGSYFATKVLIADLRHGSIPVFMRDLRGFMRSGLIDGNIVRMWRDHRQVSHYRRVVRESLADLTGPPDTWQ